MQYDAKATLRACSLELVALKIFLDFLEKKKGNARPSYSRVDTARFEKCENLKKKADSSINLDFGKKML